MVERILSCILIANKKAHVKTSIKRLIESSKECIHFHHQTFFTDDF